MRTSGDATKTNRIALGSPPRALARVGSLHYPEGVPGIVLVVDHDLDLRDLLQLALEHRGFAVKTFAEAEGAIEYIEGHANQIEGLIADVMLPGGGGFSVCETLAESNPHARILAITADARQLRGPRDDRFRMLLKPIPLDALCMALEGHEGV